MLTKFRNNKEAAAILAAKLSGIVCGTEYMPLITIGEDVEIKLTHRSNLRAEVNAADYDVQLNGKLKPWCSIAVKESAERAPRSSAFKSFPAYYEADLDLLATKIRKLAEQFKGSHARALELRQKNATQKDSDLLLRTQHVPELIACGLAAFEEDGDSQYPYVVERRKQEMKPISLRGMAYHFNASSDHLKVTLTLPYDKAQKVLSFLRDELTHKSKVE